MIVDLIPSVSSLRDLCAITGLRLDTVRTAAAPFIAIMKLGGTLPPCVCGKERFHRYGCKGSAAKGIYASGTYGVSVERMSLLLPRREKVLAAIMTGDPYSEIENRLGLSKKTARKYLRFLTPAQVAYRKRLEGQRGRRVVEARPFKDSLYARIASAVPRWMSPELREDIISEMYIAVSSGELPLDHVEKSARRYASAASSQFQSKFGDRSLDEKLFDDSGKTLGDTIVDPAGLLAFTTLDDMPLNRRRREAQL